MNDETEPTAADATEAQGGESRAFEQATEGDATQNSGPDDGTASGDVADAELGAADRDAEPLGGATVAYLSYLIAWLGAAARRIRDDMSPPSRVFPPWPACEQCGKPRGKASQRFCTQCRNQLPDLSVPPPPLASSQSRAWGLAAVVVVLLIIIAAATSSGASTPTSDNLVPNTTPDTTSNQFEAPTDIPTTTSPPTTPAGTQIPESQLAAGDCFAFVGQPNAVDDVQPKTQVDEVPCDGPHPFETVAVLTYPGGLTDAYPGNETINAYADSQCAPLYNSYTVGSSLSLTSSFSFPSATTWPTGDRTIVCYLHDSSGALLTSAVGGTTTTTSPPAPPSGTQSSINSDDVNVRTGPGANYSSITALNTGDQISIQCAAQGDNINGNSQWDQININGQTGYVSDDYVNDNGASLPSC